MLGQKPPAGEDPKRDHYKSKADIVAFVKKSFADGATAIQSKGEKGLTTEVVYFPQQKARVIDIAYGIIEHSGEHYGQLVVYYPSQVLCRRSRGPRSKAQETRYPVLIARHLREWAGILVFGTLVFNAPRGIWISLLSFGCKIWGSVARRPSRRPVRIPQ